jgi:hypothetical protein
MTVGVPVWGPWTTFYDSVGQTPSMARGDTEDGLIVSFTTDRMELTLGGDQDAPFAGAIALAGALPASMPDDYPLLGFLLLVNGQITKTLGSEAAVTCSIGHATHSIEWPIDAPEGLPGPRPPNSGEESAFPEDAVLDRGFSVQCFTFAFPPGAIGEPPFPPLPPLPITMSLQARRRFVDEMVTMRVIGFDVRIVRSH